MGAYLEIPRRQWTDAVDWLGGCVGRIWHKTHDGDGVRQQTIRNREL